MHTDLQFSSGFLSFRGDSDVERLDERALADVGIGRATDGSFEHDGRKITDPEKAPVLRRLFAIARAPLFGREIRHA